MGVTVRAHKPLLDRPPHVHPYKPGSWKAADKLVADCGGRHGPWARHD